MSDLLVFMAFAHAQSHSHSDHRQQHLPRSEEERLAKHRGKYRVPLWQHRQIVQEAAAAAVAGRQATSRGEVGVGVGESAAGLYQRSHTPSTRQQRRGSSSPKKIQQGSFSRLSRLLHGEA